MDVPCSDGGCSSGARTELLLGATLRIRARRQDNDCAGDTGLLGFVPSPLGPDRRRVGTVTRLG